jgi:hypothetical protein
MGDIDEKKGVPHPDEEDLFLSEVVCGEAELLFLDSYLQDIFRNCD